MGAVFPAEPANRGAKSGGWHRSHVGDAEAATVGVRAVESRVLHGVERAIAAIAARQENVVAREQLIAVGLGRGAIAHRLKVGAWQRLYNKVTKMRGIPLTSVARTICDLASTEPAREVDAAFQEALYRRLVSDRALAAIIAREPRRPGAPMIRALIEDPPMSRSQRERALFKLLDAAQLRRPVTNVRLHGYLVDAYWPAEGLVVEFDGYGAHGHRLAFHNNRKRDQVLLAHGVPTLRVTDRHLTSEPVALIARIAQSLKA